MDIKIKRYWINRLEKYLNNNTYYIPLNELNVSCCRFIDTLEKQGAKITSNPIMKELIIKLV